MTELYTLPTCPICKIIKQKLARKEIPFVERNFEDLPKELVVDRAPVLAIDNGNYSNYPIYLLTPTDINEWIEAV